MNATQIGLLTGLALGLAAALGGLVGFLLTLVLGAGGLAVGRYLDGALDAGSFFGRGRDDR